MNKIRGNTVGTTIARRAVTDDTTISQRAWSSKHTIDMLCPHFEETGTMVRCEPVNGYPLSITAEGSTAISRCGKNLIDYTQAVPRTTGQVVNIIENGVEWVSGNYYFMIPCDIKAGDVVVFSCVDNADAINGIILYNSETKTESSSLIGKNKAITVNADADTVRVYKKEPAVMIETPIVITNLQLEYGNTATAYDSYKGIETFAPSETIPALSGVNTIWADSGEITVSGRADPVAIIEKLTQAVLSMGSNV